MTAHQQALLLRLAAASITQETRSIIVLQRMLHDLGMSDMEQHAACAALRGALDSIILSQARLFDKAA